MAANIVYELWTSYRFYLYQVMMFFIERELKEKMESTRCVLVVWRKGSSMAPP